VRKSLANGHRRANGTGRGAARGDSAASRPRANGEAVAANRGIDMKPLQGYLGYALRRAQMLAYADFIAALGELSLSPGQFGVLTVIETNPGLKQTEVSGALGIQKTNFVSVLNEFERRGLAKRRPAADDRRSYALYLTPAGQSLLRRARAAQARHEAHLVRRIGPQGRQQLLVLLNRLTAGE
jgi:DNA-binding MarR family transcriptional regulator